MTDSDRARYSRQILLDEVGEGGQATLAEAAVLVVGAGGLGSPVLHHLVASGVRTVGLVEFDDVDVSNLHRQTLYDTDDVGQPKVEAAARRLAAVNPGVELRLHEGRLSAENADRLVGSYDVVVDGSDTFATRYVVNDAAVHAGVPDVYASVSQFSGQASVFAATDGPCYRCLFPDPPPAGLIPNCAEGGVLGVVPALLGTIQATETIKLILGLGSPLVGRLLLVDALAMEMREIAVERDPSCPACGVSRRVPSPVSESPEITVRELRERLGSAHPPELLDVREAAERERGHLGGRLIPLGQLSARAFELDGARDLVVYCQSGGRSMTAARLLRERGIEAVSLRGGMDAWTAQEPA